tara:strand:- start:921 stop:1058 length:138 start_codon:yes stop_codon:yes gene_type:complete
VYRLFQNSGYSIERVREIREAASSEEIARRLMDAVEEGKLQDISL